LTTQTLSQGETMTATAKPGKAQLETITPEKLRAIIADLRVKANDAQTREIFLALFGGIHHLEVFSADGGLGIGTFANLVGLPASTVRHYVELGLVRPYIVSGKFRFVAPNYVEVQHVRQWVDLGMKLEEIVEKTAARGGFGSVMPTFTLNGEEVKNATMYMAREPSAGGELESAQHEKLRATAKMEVERSRQDVEAQIQHLEAKQKELNAKLKRARELRTRLETKPA
jgi:DNA-binding transcriptional MerR regulator